MEDPRTTKGLYCGADLHGTNVVLCVIDQDGTTVFERRVKPNLDAINNALGPYWERIRTIAVESTFNWYWFVDGLQEQGRNVRLANPGKMEQYAGMKCTGDESDARWIAEMLRLGILPECHVYPREQRAIRDALRRRMLLMHQRTQTMLSLGGVLAREGLAIPSAEDLKEEMTARVLTKGITDRFLILQLGSLLRACQHSHELVTEIETEVLAAVKSMPEFVRAQLVPGIGKILGMCICLESGDFTRFPSAGDYASYCRTVKSVCTSNGKKKGRNNAKNGNPYLSWAFAEAATFAIRYSPRVKAWYEKKKRRRNIPVAMKALACKMAKAVWHVMNGKEYNEQLLFG